MRRLRDPLTEEDWDRAWLNERVHPKDLFLYMWEPIRDLLDPDWSVLDIGGGRGDFLVWLREEGHKGSLAMADVSLVGCAMARERCLDSIHLSGPLPNDLKYDAVVCTQMLNALEDPKEMVSEIIKVSSRLAAILYRHGSVHKSITHDISPWDLLEWMAEHGPARVECLVYNCVLGTLCK